MELLNFPDNPSEAIKLQRKLARRVISRDRLSPRIRYIAGVDVAFPDHGRQTHAAVVLMSYPELTVVAYSQHTCPTHFPYIPGLLSFRELPAILKALDKLDHHPDVVLCDGQGIAHPRRFGIACHLGVITDLPTIGVGKSRLCGTHAEPESIPGCYELLRDGEEVLGKVMCTRERVKPVYVSIGHRISLETAGKLVMACTTRYRLPEPLRLADFVSKHGRLPRNR